NIGNPRSAVTVYDLAQRIRRLTGCPGEIVFAPLGYVDVELRIPNVEKARELLGWEPRVELDDGLARTIEWDRAKTKREYASGRRRWARTSSRQSPPSSRQGCSRRAPSSRTSRPSS